MCLLLKEFTCRMLIRRKNIQTTAVTLRLIMVDRPTSCETITIRTAEEFNILVERGSCTGSAWLLPSENAERSWLAGGMQAGWRSLQPVVETRSLLSNPSQAHKIII